eukprot:TRINITY_DN545_c1_g1_i1.p1 TRINITY_DN545_c1_g1~~TRINITY_DN545_c1_g1_i1.p1  ORF type:complete len:330 (-),score=43.62 TRINITY_DN545_c1_g1_i1:104-1093(-)
MQWIHNPVFFILLLTVKETYLLQGAANQDQGSIGSQRKLLQQQNYIYPDCGWRTRVTSAPYVASIQLKDPMRETYWHQCGGVQLTSRAVLTTASCVSPFRQEHSEEFGSYTGELIGMMHVSLSPYCRHTEGRTRIQLSRYYIHPNYLFDVESQFQNNIAIVEMAQSDISGRPDEDSLYVSYSSQKDPNFPSWDQILDANLTSIGYGQKNYSEGMARTTEAYFMSMLPYDEDQIRFLDEEQCEALSEAYNLTQYDLRDVVCGTMISGDLCQGDGGTPVMYKEPGGRDAVVGLFSSSTPKQCGDYQGEPMIFTNVTRFEEWISEVLDKIQA